jgi:hypothetical protein
VIALKYVWKALQYVALLVASTAALSQDEATLLRESTIVFNGTVVKLAATSFEEVPVSSETIVVRVESIMKKPTAVALKPADNVTVEVKDPRAYQPGSRATFYTDTWMLGSGVAVKEIGHIAQSGAAAATSLQLPQSRSDDDQLRTRLRAAEAVVVGRVLSVRPWQAAKAVAAHSHISEHDPNWQEAVVQVRSTLKGSTGNRLIVRFPGSRDVAWANAPKFKPGQAATLILKSDQVSGSPKAMMAGNEVTAYTALQPGDVLSTEEATRARALLQ